MNTYIPITDVSANENTRITTGLKAIDNFLGGGFVDSEVIQIGGSPGSGKSSLMMQLATIFNDKGYITLYFSGEESLGQIRLRAERLNALRTNLICTETLEVNEMFKMIEKINSKLVIVDSMPMIYSDTIDAPIGSDKQVKQTMLQFTHYIKQTNRIAIVVSHGTKQGTLAGLMKIMHMVDVTLYLRNEHGNRILESTKNRFGATAELSLTMTELGFQELNPNFKQQTIQQPIDNQSSIKSYPINKRDRLSLWLLVVIGLEIIAFIFH